MSSNEKVKQKAFLAFKDNCVELQKAGFSKTAIRNLFKDALKDAESSAAVEGNREKNLSSATAIRFSEIVKEVYGLDINSHVVLSHIKSVIKNLDPYKIFQDINLNDESIEILLKAAEIKDEVPTSNSIIIFAGDLLKKATELLNKDNPLEDVLKGFECALNESINILENIQFKAEVSVKSLPSWVSDSSKYLSKTEVMNDYRFRMLTKRSLPIILRKPKLIMYDCECNAESILPAEEDDIFFEGETKESYAETLLESLPILLRAVECNIVFSKKFDYSALCYLMEYIIPITLRNTSDSRRVQKMVGGIPSLNLVADYPDEKALGSADEVILEDSDGCSVVIIKNDAKILIVENITYEKPYLEGHNLMKTRKVNVNAVPVGGATEFEIARRLKTYAGTSPKKYQLGIEKFAEALETIATDYQINHTDCGKQIFECGCNFDYVSSKISGMKQSLEAVTAILKL